MRPDNTNEIHLLGFLPHKLQWEARVAAVQKGTLGRKLGAAAQDMSVFPLVGAIDDRKVVEYNALAVVPKEWVLDPETGALDTARLPEKRFPTPYRDNGLIDYNKLDELADDHGLSSQKERERETLAHIAHDIVNNGTNIHVSEDLILLRNRYGVNQPAASKYDLPEKPRASTTAPQETTLRPAPAAM